MSAARERVQHEADARWPLESNPLADEYNRHRRGGFVEGRTIRVGSAEWVDAVNQAEAYLDGMAAWEPDDRRTVAAGLVHTVLTGAGVIVEEATDG